MLNLEERCTSDNFEKLQKFLKGEGGVTGLKTPILIKAHLKLLPNLHAKFQLSISLVINNFHYSCPSAAPRPNMNMIEFWLKVIPTPTYKICQHLKIDA